jgi:RES domain-containing protein
LRLPLTRLTRPVYRGHHPRWSFDPESGDGASRYGGRFNPPGIPALYTSLRPQTAWLEAQQSFPFKAQPLTLCAYDVDCTDLLDLTDAAVRSAVGTTIEELGCAWEEMVDSGSTPPSWRLMMRLRAENAAGIVVQSFAKGATDRDITVVFWDWSKTPPHQVRVIDDQARLPSNDRSWR